jgi:Fe-S cluster assembly protein SufD
LPEDRISAIAWTNAAKTLLIDEPANAEISDPSFLTAKLANSEAKALHVFVRVGANAKATIVLDHVGLGVLAENVEILF